MALDTNTPTFLQANSYPAEVTRRSIAFMLARDVSGDVGSITGGFVNVGANDFLMVAPVSGMSVNVSVGECLVQGSSTTSQSGYYVRNASTTNVSIATSDPTNPRIDGVYVVVADAQYAGVTNVGSITVVTGTPTSGATLINLSGKGAAPVSSLLIGYVLVPANATSIITADLGDKRAQLGLGVASTITAAQIEGAFTAAGQVFVGTGTGTGALAIAGQAITIGATTIGVNGIENVNVVATSGTAQTLGAVNAFIGNNITLSGSCNIAMPTGTQGAFCYAFVQQPASGTNTWTATFTGVKWAGGTAPTISTGTSVIDLYQFVSGGTTGTAWYGVIVAQAMQ